MCVPVCMQMDQTLQAVHEIHAMAGLPSPSDNQASALDYSKSAWAACSLACPRYPLLTKQLPPSCL